MLVALGIVGLIGITFIYLVIRGAAKIEEDRERHGGDAYV